MAVVVMLHQRPGPSSRHAQAECACPLPPSLPRVSRELAFRAELAHLGCLQWMLLMPARPCEAPAPRHGAGRGQAALCCDEAESAEPAFSIGTDGSAEARGLPDNISWENNEDACMPLSRPIRIPCLLLPSRPSR